MTTRRPRPRLSLPTTVATISSLDRGARMREIAPAMKTLSPVFALPLLLAAGCAVTSDSTDTGDEQDVTTRYVHLSELDGLDYDKWLDVRAKLRTEFDEICGDSFCEGEYANYVPLSFDCGVSSVRGNIRDCAWTFAASLTGVDANTAAIGVDAPTFECHFTPSTTGFALVDTLFAADNALHAPLPGLAGSIYEELGACFDNPLHGTPLTVAGSPTPTYVDAETYYTTYPNQATWRRAEAALVADFDRLCGDTFCGGDFGDLRVTDVVCAVTRSTGNVRGCQWVVSGSYSLVTSRGMLNETSRSFACPFTMSGTLYRLIQTLNGAGTEDPIFRPLPGTTATAYDALLECLP
jgi:hypothetical protein